MYAMGMGTPALPPYPLPTLYLWDTVRFIGQIGWYNTDTNQERNEKEK